MRVDECVNVDVGVVRAIAGVVRANVGLSELFLVVCFQMLSHGEEPRRRVANLPPNQRKAYHQPFEQVSD